MTQDEIIEMAREAGFEDFVRWSERYPHEVQRWIERMTAFTKLVAAKKQEDIIQIIKETPFSNWFQGDVIEAIRARGEQA